MTVNRISLTHVYLDGFDHNVSSESRSICWYTASAELSLGKEEHTPEFISSCQVIMGAPNQGVS